MANISVMPLLSRDSAALNCSITADTITRLDMASVSAQTQTQGQQKAHLQPKIGPHLSLWLTSISTLSVRTVRTTECI
jgi:hypothetical protein